MVPITGEVTYNGEPLTHGRVVYLPASPSVGRQANGPIQPDGTFSLTTQNSNDGAMHGEYHIVVFSRTGGANKAASREEFEKAAKKSNGSAIPLKFNDHRTSGLKDTVDGDHSGFKKLELTD